MSLIELMELPLPLYQDYVEYQSKEKTKQLNRQINKHKQEMANIKPS